MGVMHQCVCITTEETETCAVAMNMCSHAERIGVYTLTQTLPTPLNKPRAESKPLRPCNNKQ
jgi:hypothetical protein